MKIELFVASLHSRAQLESRSEQTLVIISTMIFDSLA